MNSKLGKVLTYSERLSSLNPHDRVTNVRLRDDLENLYFHYHKNYGQ